MLETVFRPILAFLAVFGLSGGPNAFNPPLNEFVAEQSEPIPVWPSNPDSDDATIIGLAFSGGGSRSAAFAFGILQELEQTAMSDDPRGRSMLDAVRFIVGSSGGSLTAAYYGLKGKEGYGDFRKRFLIRDAQVDVQVDLTPSSFLRAFTGGVNGRETFARWLDKNLFKGATFADMQRPGRPAIWLNASDLFNRTPFIFNSETFAALCSDLGKLPLSEVVAAANAVPVLFSPLAIEAYGSRCSYQSPAWVDDVRKDPLSPAMLRAFARSLDVYRDPDRIKYVKLADGALADDYGVSSFVFARAASGTPYGPLTRREAVRLKRFIYLVADAGRMPEGEWARRTEGPGIVDVVMAIVDTAIQNSARYGYDMMRLTMNEWRRDLVEYRCGLDESEVLALRGNLTGWDCRDVEFFVSEISFDTLGDETRTRLQGVLTRLKMSEEQADLTIAAGREALRSNPAFLAALQSMAETALSAKAPATKIQ